MKSPVAHIKYFRSKNFLIIIQILLILQLKIIKCNEVITEQTPITTTIINDDVDDVDGTVTSVEHLYETSTTITTVTTSDSHDTIIKPTTVEIEATKITSTIIEISDICINYNNNLENNYKSNKININNKNNNIFTIVVLTKEPTSSIFIADRINEIGLIDGNNIKLEIRWTMIEKSSELKNILLNEIELLQECVKFPLGIFISHSLWPIVSPIVDDIEYNVWMLPGTDSVMFNMFLHVFYELPWLESKEHKLSIDVQASTLNTYNNFMYYAKKQRLCFNNHEDGEQIYILIGGDNLQSTNYANDGTIIALPLDQDRDFITDLPTKSLIFLETEIDLNQINDDYLSSTYDENNYPAKFTPTNLIIMSSELINLAKWLNKSVNQYCNRTNVNEPINLADCNTELLLDNIPNWRQNRFNYTTIDLLQTLNIDNLTTVLTYDLLQKLKVKLNDTEEFVELRQISSINLATNILTYYHYPNNNNMTTTDKENQVSKVGHIFNCSLIENEMNIYDSDLTSTYSGTPPMYWRLKAEAWVAVGLTTSILGILVCLAILIFIIVRVCMDDILEGNPICSLLILISLIALFSSIVPFCIEYIGDFHQIDNTYDVIQTQNILCSVRVFLVTLCYCITFSLLLCRAIMLASIGSEGGFLSHVNGYIQSVICVFSTLVQIGLSTQLFIIMIEAEKNISCDTIFHGNWIWGLLLYDGFLLIVLLVLSPFIFRSQRNYREGMLLVIGAILCVFVWIIWIPLSMLGNHWRDAAVPLGAQATGWAILFGILIPRSFLIVRGIARSDLAQALPSLTTLAFAQNNQYVSEQSIYECVNPAMRQRTPQDETFSENDINNVSPSEIPTLPLRASRHTSNNINNNMNNYYGQQEPNLPLSSLNKVTRF